MVIRGLSFPAEHGSELVNIPTSKANPFTPLAEDITEIGMILGLSNGLYRVYIYILGLHWDNVCFEASLLFARDRALGTLRRLALVL